MTETNTKGSAVQCPDPLATKELEHAFFEGLRELWLRCGADTSKHEQARILIMACIEGGVGSGKRIVGILSKIGFNARHIGATLDRQCGSNPDLHDWWKDDEGNYRLHQSAAQLEAASIVI